MPPPSYLPVLYGPQVPYYSSPPQYAVDQDGNLVPISAQQLARFYEKQSTQDRPRARSEAKTQSQHSDREKQAASKASNAPAVNSGSGKGVFRFNPESLNAVSPFM